MTKSRFVLMVLSIFFVLFFFSIIVHPFEVPDEQSHYATVHYLVNEGKMPILSDHQDLSIEEEQTEYIFGIMSNGNNKYSYHPEFRIPLSNGLVGPFEQEIKSYNTPQLRRSYTIHQAAIYPPLYYYLTAPLYYLVQSGDILLRLFVSRISSVLLTTLTIITGYLFGRLAFTEKKYASTLALMILFFPMTSYIGVGVNSDNLHNLFFTVFLTLCIKHIKDGWNTRLSVLTGVIIGFDVLTKPQAYIMIPIFLLAVLLRGIRNWKLSFKQLGYFILPILIITSLYTQPQYLDTGNIITSQSFINFVHHYLSLVGPMLVWYWGVFKWFGVVLPHPVWWLANRLVLLAVVGLVIKFVKDSRKHNFRFENKVVLFALLANLGYLLALLLFDWQFYQQIGRSLGLQARYFLPLLSTQLFLLLYGLVSLSRNAKIREIIRRGIIIFFLTLHITGLFTQLLSYYDLSSWSIVINQISQYRPMYAKGDWWYLWITLYLAGIICICTLCARSSSSPHTTKPRS